MNAEAGAVASTSITIQVYANVVRTMKRTKAAYVHKYAAEVHFSFCQRCFPPRSYTDARSIYDLSGWERDIPCNMYIKSVPLEFTF